MIAESSAESSKREVGIVREGFNAALIETFHGEAMEQFHKMAKEKGLTAYSTGCHVVVPVLDGVSVNSIIANFKAKIMSAYGISSHPGRGVKNEDRSKQS